MSNQLAALVIEMMRQKKADERDQKDKAYDMWKLRESQDFQEKITQSTREYQLEHEQFVIAKNAENEAEKNLAAATNEGVKLGMDLDKIQDLYATNDAIKVIDNLILPATNNLEDLSEHYNKKAEGHKLKMDLLNDVIYNDIASANQIIAGGRGTGVDFGTDPKGWDLEDIGLPAYIEKFDEQLSSDEITKNFNSGLGQLIYGEGATTEQSSVAGDAYAIATNKDAEYVNSDGKAVKVGGTDPRAVMADILQISIDEIPQIKDVDNMKAELSLTTFDPIYTSGDPSTTESEVRDALVADFFTEKGGAIQTSLQEIKDKEIASAYKVGATYLNQSRIDKIEEEISLSKAAKAKNRLYTYIKSSEYDSKIESIYDNAFYLTAEGGVHETLKLDDGQAQFDKWNSEIAEWKSDIAMNLLMATDYDKGQRYFAEKDPERLKILTEKYFDTYEKILQLAEGVSERHFGVTQEQNFTEYYNYLKMSIENYENADAGVKPKIRDAILLTFGAPSNIQTEADMYEWYGNVVEDYSLTLGVQIDGAGNLLNSSSNTEPEEEDENLFDKYGQ